MLGLGVYEEWEAESGAAVMNRCHFKNVHALVQSIYQRVRVEEQPQLLRCR